MKLAIISLVLFFAMKLIYSYWGDYASHYWNVVYYSGLYFMLVSLLRYIRMVAYTKLQKQFLGLGCLYFGILLIVHLTCFFKIELYVRFISDIGKITIGSVILIIGLIVINYLRLKNNDPKN